MSPRTPIGARARRVQETAVLLAAQFATQARDARRRRGWTMAELARRAGMSRGEVQAIEHGRRASLASYVTIALALGMEPVLEMRDPRRRSALTRTEDPVHAAMAEMEARRLQTFGCRVAVDEPYQHFQFAGRADLVAWRLDPPALLHIENRTRFPNVGDMAGAWNAKRSYLASVLARRIGIAGFNSETHVMVCLWSSEVLHSLRMRRATFRALAPDPATAFQAWWTGEPPARGRSSTLVVLDPFARGRQRQTIDLETALGTVGPRLRGYAEAVERLAADE